MQGTQYAPRESILCMEHFVALHSLPNGTKLSNFMDYCKCSAHFSKGNMLYFQLKFCIFQYTNSTCIHNDIIRVCITISS